MTNSESPQANAISTSRSSTATATDIAYIAVFAAIIMVLGFVAIPAGVFGVPIVLQNAAITFYTDLMEAKP